MRNNHLFCIVADRAQAEVVKPDMGHYSPKELAFKEGVSTASVYSWLREGLPAMRQGRLGNIRIYYQDYIRWMIECAKRPDCKVHDVPIWAFWFVRVASKKP